ncbi:hypothetical protein N8920_08975 [Opitutales bacterium]|nr:hypothetical protein [Opitutales bacterium]
MKENEKGVLGIILDFGRGTMSVIESPFQRALPGCSLIIGQKFLYIFACAYRKQLKRKSVDKKGNFIGFDFRGWPV